MLWLRFDQGFQNIINMDAHVVSMEVLRVFLCVMLTVKNAAGLHLKQFTKTQ